MGKDDLVRAAILRAAETVFKKWGITKTTMEDIAHEAGKGKSTLYYYFKSKEEVLDAVAQVQIARISGAAQAAIDQKSTAREKLIAYVYSTFKGIRKAMAPYDIGRVELKTHKALVDGILRKVEVVDQRIIESILGLGVERGEFKSIGLRDIKAAARAILTVKRSVTTDLFINNHDKQVIDSIIKLMSEGL